MNHHAYVRLVDAHAEGDSRYDDWDFVTDELFLSLPANFRPQPGMVSQSVESFLRQVIHQLFGAVAGKAVDDDRLVLVLIQEGQELIEGLSLGLDCVIEIGPVEAGDKNLGLPET